MSSPILKKPKNANVHAAHSMVLASSAGWADHRALIFRNIGGVMGRRVLVGRGALALALAIPCDTNLSLGIVEWAVSGKPSANC